MLDAMKLRLFFVLANLLVFWGGISTCQAQAEKHVFQFSDRKQHRIEVISDSLEQHLKVRFTYRGRLMFQEPVNDSVSLDSLHYSYYMRPGGKLNDGLDLNYLSFWHEGLLVVLYDEWSAFESAHYCGVRFFDARMEKKEEWSADRKTIKGSLINLRDWDGLSRIDRLFMD